MQTESTEVPGFHPQIGSPQVPDFTLLIDNFKGFRINSH